MVSMIFYHTNVKPEICQSSVSASDACFWFQYEGHERGAAVDYETAFEKMKKAAGVDTIKEILVRFTTQGHTGQVRKLS